MQYVEVLRVRRVLLWFLGIVLGMVILSIVSTYAGTHGDIHAGGGTLHFADLVLGCVFGAWIVTTCVAPGLSNESALTAPIVWTRPLSRQQIAWRYVAVDVAAITLGYVALIAVAMLALAAFGALGIVVTEPRAGATFALGLGAAMMWYALVLLVSARIPARGGMIAGLSWAVFIAIGTLWAAPMPAPVHAVFGALNYLNPMAWIGGVSSASHHSVQHAVELPMPLQILGCWAIAAVAAVVAVRLWATREV